MKKEDKDSLKNQITDLLANDLNESLPPSNIQPVEPFDNLTVTNEARAKAQKLVLSCLKLYFDEKIIEKNEFMQAKSAVTTSNIMTLFKQIKVAEFFIDKIVNDVDSGNLNPRIFEVATGIQSNIIDMLKNTQLHVISMQEEYRRLQGEMPKSEFEANTINIKNTDGSSTKIYTNSKALLRDLDNEEETDDVDAED
jgi:hypothetical protein